MKIQGFELRAPNILKLFVGFLIFIAPVGSSAGVIHNLAKEKNFELLLTAVEMLPLQHMQEVLESVDETNTAYTLRGILTTYGQEGRVIIERIEGLVAQAYAASDAMDTKAEPSRKHGRDSESSSASSTKVAKTLHFDSASINDHLAGTSMECETKFPSGDSSPVTMKRSRVDQLLEPPSIKFQRSARMRISSSSDSAEFPKSTARSRALVDEARKKYLEEKKERERVRLEAKQLAEILKERVKTVTNRTKTRFPMEMGTHFDLVLAGTKLNCSRCKEQASIIQLRCPGAHRFCINCVGTLTANEKFWAGAGSGSFNLCPFCRWTRKIR